MTMECTPYERLIMKWTKRLIILVFLLVVLIPIIMLLRMKWYGGVLHTENFNKITPGMLLSDVEALLGGPSGNYGRPWPTTFGQSDEGIVVPSATKVRYWVNDSCKLEIYFTSGNTVSFTHKRASYFQSGEMTFAEKVKYIFSRLLAW